MGARWRGGRVQGTWAPITKASVGAVAMVAGPMYIRHATTVAATRPAAAATAARGRGTMPGDILRLFVVVRNRLLSEVSLPESATRADLGHRRTPLVGIIFAQSLR